MALVQITANPECHVSKWTTSSQVFTKWTQEIKFATPANTKISIADGLKSALELYPCPLGKNKQYHCLLIVSDHTKVCLQEATTVAKSFKRQSVSLSIICTTKTTGIDSLYYLAKIDESTKDYAFKHVSPMAEYLSLISGVLIDTFDKLTTELQLVLPKTVQNPTLKRKREANATEEVWNVSDDEESEDDQLGSIKLVWKGALTAKMEEQIVVITTLSVHMYQAVSDKMLVKDWPSTMLIDRLVTEDFFVPKPEEIVIFKPAGQHKLFETMHKQHLLAVIELPSQVLGLPPPDTEGFMHGWLFSRELWADSMAGWLQE